MRDPFGNLWWIQTRLDEVAEEEIWQRFSDPKWIAAMAYVTSADLFPDGKIVPSDNALKPTQPAG